MLIPRRRGDRMSDSPHLAFGVKQAMVRVESGSAQEQTWPVWPSDQFSAKGGHQRRFTICQALASLQGRISQGWDKSKCPCNCGIGIAVKRSLPHSPKLHTKRQRQLSILHFLDVLASGNSYRAMRPHGTDACGLCFQSVHQLGFRYTLLRATSGRAARSGSATARPSPLACPFSKPHPRQQP